VYLESLFSLVGRTAMVTGGNSGMGRAIAEGLAGAGARLVLVARDEKRLRETAAQTGATWIAADLGNRDDVARVAASEPPDILVNAAAVNLRPPLVDLSIVDWDTTIAVNLTAPFLLGQAFAPSMAERGWGRIITLASQQAVRAYGNSGAYGAAKAGVTGLTRSQAEAWSRFGICCNAIAPGIVRTPMTRAIFDDPQRADAAARRTMIGRNGEAADYVGVALFLASPASNYVTGQTIFVDGGFSVA
jgi:gluconate 5-dehydrogenase